MAKLRFQDIPKFPRAHYEVSVSWNYIEQALEEFNAAGQLDLDPDFQRAHVWTPVQKAAYVEYILRGGEIARAITFNCPGWPNNTEDPIVLVDGKQRLEAVRGFYRGEVLAFGRLITDIEGKPDMMTARFDFRVCALESRKDLLELYLNINAGGTPHTDDELNRVRKLLASA